MSECINCGSITTHILCYDCLLAVNAYLRTRIAELEAMTTWQPIETCPEKTDVLLLIPSISGLHVEQGEKIRNQYFALYGYSREFEPTHWMPVPPAPEGGKE